MKQHYKSTPHKELAMTHYISLMLISLPNILAITGGVSSRQKEGKEKPLFGTRQNNCTISHDCLTTAMFGSARTCYFVTRKQVRKNDRRRPRTFCCFRSYQKALEKAGTAMLESKPFKNTKKSRALSRCSVMLLFSKSLC